jgi:flavin-binding protein dodecin
VNYARRQQYRRLAHAGKAALGSAVAAAVETAAKTVRDLRVAEVIRQDVTIGSGGIVNYRVRPGISFKYGTDD